MFLEIWREVTTILAISQLFHAKYYFRPFFSVSQEKHVILQLRFFTGQNDERLSSAGKKKDVLCSRAHMSESLQMRMNT